MAQLTDKDIDYFKAILAPSGVSQDEGDLEAFNNDWMQKYRGQSKLVLKPSTTEQVSKILKYCNDNKYVPSLRSFFLMATWIIR
jgi:FAD/FMN-containing dehydrogenase